MGHSARGNPPLDGLGVRLDRLRQILNGASTLANRIVQALMPVEYSGYLKTLGMGKVLIERVTSVVNFERFISLLKAKRKSLVNWEDRDLSQLEWSVLPNTQGKKSAAGRLTPPIQSAVLRS